MFRKMAVLGLVAAGMLWLSCSENNKSTSLTSGSIEGRVTVNGVGIPGVTIVVTPYVITQGGFGKTGDPSGEFGSTSDGDYHIDILPGSYAVDFDVNYLGEHLSASRYPVEVVSDGTVTLNVELKDPAPANLILREDNAVVIITFESAYRPEYHKIYRSPANQDNFEVIATIDNYYGGTITYSDDPPAVQSYKYKATAVTGGVESAPTNIAQINFTGMIAPPNGFDASDQIAFVRLIWNQNYYAIRYKIYKSSSQNDWSLLDSTTSAAYADTPGVHGIYSYRITSISRYGTESIPTNPVTVNYDGRLDAPEDLTIADHGSLLYLTWDLMEQAAYYNIYRSTSSNGVYNRIDSSFSYHYSDRPMPDGRYYYKVTVVGYNGLESDFSNSVGIDFDGVLDPPNSISVVDRGLTVLVDWGYVAWAGAYVIYRSDDGGTTYTQIARISTSNFQYTDTPPSAGDYYYKMAVESMDGTLGPLSAPVLGHCSANFFAPEGVYAQSMGFYVIVGWNTISGATGYSIYRASNISGDYIEIEDNIQYPTFHDEPPTAGPYFYRVEAFDNNGHRSPKSSYAYVYYSARPLTPSIYSLSEHGYYVLVHWSSSGYVDSTLVYRATSFNGPYSPQFWATGSSGYDWPPAAGHYYYKVQTIYQGITSELSDYAHIYFTGVFNAPSNIYGYDAGTSVSLGWTSVSYAASYDLYRGTSPDNLTLNQTVYTNTATDTPPGAGTYYYAVLARTRGGLASPLCSPVMVEFTP